jgi:hypothetical protein
VDNAPDIGDLIGKLDYLGTCREVRRMGDLQALVLGFGPLLVVHEACDHLTYLWTKDRFQFHWGGLGIFQRAHHPAQ